MNSQKLELKKLQYDFFPNEKSFYPNIFLPELIGLASGVKKIATFEVEDKKAVDSLKECLNILNPKIKFKTLISPSYDWNKKCKEKYHWNIFIKLIDHRFDLEKFNKIYKIATSSIEINREVANYLSYPKCCADAAYNQTYQPKSLKDYFKIGKVNKIDFRINNFYLRSSSNALLIHWYVCNYKCLKTIKYSQKILNFLKKQHLSIYNFYKNTLTMPILMIADNENPQRIIGNGVVFTFSGNYQDNQILNYNGVWYFGEGNGSQYLNKEEGQNILQDILRGNKIIMTKKGMKIYNSKKLIKEVNNNRLVFINPIKY